MDSEIDGGPRIKNTNLRFFRGVRAFEWFPLAKVGDRFRLLPQRVVEGSIERGTPINSGGLSDPRSILWRRTRTRRRAGGGIH
jgi:hypothetical protein